LSPFSYLGEEAAEPSLDVVVGGLRRAESTPGGPGRRAAEAARLFNAVYAAPPRGNAA